MNIEISRASSKDAQLLFNWANETITRQNSFSPDPINWDNHLDWFNRKLKESSTEIYIFHIGDNPVGVVRFETDVTTIIGVTVAPNLRGRGLGTELLKLACNKFRENKKNNILAYIKKDNVHSRKAFEKAGFTFFKDDIYKNTACIILILKNK